ncbi:MAG TPA: hypothetical protein VF828_05095 [Patescibacteria group bacterium]
MRLLVFTYAPAGLGHLRVTGALVYSRPKDFPYVLLGSSDQFISKIHRFTSINPIARSIFEASQYGLIEDVFTPFLVWMYRRSSYQIYKRLIEIIEEYPDLTDVTVVATHFGLAHQIGEIKERVKKETGVTINLVVQVTDDTSQHIWVVKGADLTMVPSVLAKNRLLDYAKLKGIVFNCEVSPYPLSPLLTEAVPEREGSREHTFNKNEGDQINVIVPISGAAVGLGYLSNYLMELDKLSKRFHFLVVAKRSSATRKFLSDIGRLRWVELITGRNDNEVVRIYEKTYQENLIHIEVTKPSEQSFKALIPPALVGGSLLLFTNPVGRQEVENLNFLKRHSLLPNLADSGEISLVQKKFIPRGLTLPSDPVMAARFTIWCLDSGLFEKMASSKYKFAVESYMTSEIGYNGAWLFWEKLKMAKLI